MEGNPLVYPLVGLALGGLILGLGFAWMRRARRGGGGGGGDVERRLRAAAGDAVAERLIRFELGRAPELSRDAAAERAYDRLIADRVR